MAVLRLVSKAGAGKKAAYLFMAKVAHTSLVRTFFDSENERAQADYAARKHFDVAIKRAGYPTYSPSLLRGNRGDKSEDDIVFDFANLQGLFYDEAKQTWQVAGMATGTAGEKNYQMRPIATEEINSWFIFTFVRNPFARLVSCFQNKLPYDEKTGSFNSAGKLPLWYKFNSFAAFIHALSEMPSEDMDEHFGLQTYELDKMKRLGIAPHFIGKLENIDAEFEPLRQKYNLLPLEQRNRSVKQGNNLHQRWRDYYTPALARLIYQRYKEDFALLGYEDSYAELLHYLETRSASFARKQLKKKLFGRLGIKTYKKYAAQ